MRVLARTSVARNPPPRAAFTPDARPHGVCRFRRAKARRFYVAITKALGLGTIDNGPEAFLLGRSAEEPTPYLWIGTTRPSCWAEGSRPGLNQTHVAFFAPSKAAVDEFCRAAFAAGGRDNGKPGRRKGAGDCYGAFVLDPYGNNIEACARGPASR